MEQFYYICEFVHAAVKIWLTLYMLSALSLPRYDSRVERIVRVLVTVLAAIMNTYNNSLENGLFSNLMTVVIIGVVNIVAGILYRGHWGERISFSCWIWFGTAMLDFLVLTIVWCLTEVFNCSPEVWVTVSGYRGGYLLIKALLLLWGGIFLRRILVKYLQEWRSIWAGYKKELISGVILLAACIVYFQRIYKQLVTDVYVRYWILLLLSAIIVTGVCLLLWLVHKIKARNALQQQKIQMLETDYQELLQVQEQRQILLHDMKNHILMIHQLTEKGETQKVLEITDDLYGELRKGSHHVCTGHSMLDLILNSKTVLAQEKEIEVTIEYDSMSGLQLSALQLCALFTNILDNAIEANEQYPSNERWLKLICRKKGQMLIAVLENPAQGELQYKNGFPVTSKSKTGGLHGNGLRSVKRVVDQCGGYMNFGTENGKFRIEIVVVGFPS